VVGVFASGSLANSDPSAVPAPSVPASRGVVDVRDFGARGDGKTLDTAAINKAIAAAGSAGGGTVHFSAGTYLSGSIHLMSNVGLYLDHGATIEAAAPTVAAYDEPEPNEWGDRYKYQDFGHSHWHNALVWGENLHDVSIAGPGLINGAGLVSNDRGPKGAGDKAISLKNCRNVVLRDVSILHGGWFAILATGVDNLTIDNLKIDTNRDGIDIDACHSVRVSNCTINSPFDDGICLKSSYGLGRARSTENVTITNCQVSGYDEGTLLDGTFKRGVTDKDGPTGRIKFGTESYGGFKNIVVSNCVFEYSRGLALESVDGGSIEDVSITNITMRDIVSAPIFVRLGRRSRGPHETPVGAIRRLNISDVTAYNVGADQGVLISGIPGHPIEDLRMSNVRIVSQGGGGTKEDAVVDPPELESDYPEPARFGRLPAYGLFLRHVKGLEMHHVSLNYLKDEMRPAVFLHDVEGADFDDVKAQHGPDLVAFVLRRVKDFWIHNSPGFPDRRHESAEHESF